MSLEHELEAQKNSANEYVQKRYAGWGRAYHAKVIQGLMRDANGLILDLGCGTGIIHDLYPDLDITGVDISEDMLKYHKGYAIKAPAESLPFPDNSFDYVVCRSLLHHLPDAEKGLAEVRRVLKPGGGFAAWETNAGWLAEKIRHLTQHGDRFSHFHHSFTDLPGTVGKYLKVKEVVYQGYAGYALLGFPDIINFSAISGYFFKPLMAFDEWMSRGPLRKMGFAVRIRAVKQ